MTACRRFAKDDLVYQFLMDSLLPEIWNVISRPPLKLPIINALLLVATWPNPDIRFLTDPSMIFTGIAMNSALLTGLHTGRGAHTEFTGLLDKVDTTDEEAADLDNFILLSTLLEIQTYYFMPLPGYSEEMLKRNAIKAYTTAEALINQARSLQSQSAFLHYSPNFVFRTLLSAICVFMTLNLAQPSYTKNHSNALNASYMGASNNNSSNNINTTNNSSSSTNTNNNKTSTTTTTNSSDTADLFVREALRIIRCCSVQRDDLAMRASNMVEKYWDMRNALPRRGREEEEKGDNWVVSREEDNWVLVSSSKARVKVNMGNIVLESMAVRMGKVKEEGRDNTHRTEDWETIPTLLLSED
ncbi:hypothetical protein N0V85_008137 [Neurospora sp. IMI 360204]|nr:hypothetical protein N0V85_008137 [Neurospora sp. IMI 360204]